MASASDGAAKKPAGLYSVAFAYHYFLYDCNNDKQVMNMLSVTHSIIVLVTK